jgi:hypothetical protein
MDWVQIFAYVLGWVVLLNAVWVTYQAVFNPDIFNWMNRNPESPYLSDGSASPFRKRRAYVHIIGALVGYFFLFLIMFNLAFSFIPGNWGSLDEDGEFVAMSASLAGLASILMTALIWSTIGYAGARSSDEIAAKEKLDSALNDLDEARKGRSHAIFEAKRLHEEAKEAKLNASREKYRHENHIKNLRALISPEALDEYDRVQREKAATGPIIFYS